MTEKQINRKTFLREGLRSVVKGVSSAVGNNIKKTDKKRYLRPPGAIEESAFLTACSRCDKCYVACPHGALKPIAGEGPATGTPVIIPKETPCYLCDPVVCSYSCPEGAIAPVAAAAISIGVAVVKSESCFAAQGMDPSCNYCFDRCPLKDSAITFDRGPVIQEENCTGCGICAFYCPSNPKSIIISPL